MSRGGEIGAADLQNQHFRVWAYIQQQTPQKYMDNVDIHYDKGRGEWVYTYDSEKAYWPEGEWTYLNFYAECPATGDIYFQGSNNYADSLVVPTQWNTSAVYKIKNTDGSFKYTDLLLAFKPGQRKADLTSDKKVHLQFKHALTELRFKICTANSATRAVVRSVSLGNVRSGTIWSDTEQELAWTSTSFDMVKIPLIFNSSLGKSVSVSKDTLELCTENPLFLPEQYITQTNYSAGSPTWTGFMNNDTYLEIDCDLWMGEKQIVDGSMTHVFFPLPKDKVQNWIRGQCYTYVITLGGGYDKDGNIIAQTINIGDAKTE